MTMSEQKPRGDTVALQVPGVNFEALAQSFIASELTKHFLQVEGHVEAIVGAAMVRPVKADGTSPQYSSDKTIPWVEFVAQDLVRKAAVQALTQRIEALRPEIEKAIEVALRQAVKGSAAALVAAFIDSAKQAYYVKINVGLEPSDRHR
jgi:hypothetical protein